MNFNSELDWSNNYHYLNKNNQYTKFLFGASCLDPGNRYPNFAL